jgi:hypothetical protein
MMTENNVQSLSLVYNDLAIKYSIRKRESMVSLLSCGQILHDAKKILQHGMFQNFISDSRVGESERTAQRLMSVYRNFGHLLQDPEHRIAGLERLGLTHLLELKNLPARFRKVVQMTTEVNGEKITEDVEVIDENKLADFLDKPVKFEGASVHIRDLPATELKKYVDEASGIFAPDKDLTDEQMIDDTIEKENAPVSELPFSPADMQIKGMVVPESDSEDDFEFDTLESKGSAQEQSFVESDLNRLRSKLADFSMHINAAVGTLDSFLGRTDLEDVPVDMRNATLKELSILKGKSETLIMRLMSMEDRLR